MKVKDTNLINLQRGDILMWRAGTLLAPDWDVLGGLIKTLEGNTGTSRDPNAPGHSTGDYTHCAWLRDLPDPEAEVEEVSDRPGIFKIVDGSTWEREETHPGQWAEDPFIKVKRLASRMPIRVHATWPCVREETVDMENPHMEVWRMRRATPEIIAGVLKLADDMIGWQYDIADFLTFGNIHLPAARICSEFIADIAYNASMLRGNMYPICLTPDIRDNADVQITPNDLINGEELFRVSYQGMRA